MSTLKERMLNGPDERTRKRGAQSRTQETRQALLEAALHEFATSGFEGASTWRIAQKAGVNQQLITYHFKNKRTLWKSVAQYFLAELGDRTTNALGSWAELTASERVKKEFRLIMSFVADYPDIHRFMMQESLSGSSRLDWLTNLTTKPTLGRIRPFIEMAQKRGEMIPGDSSEIFYLILSSVLSLVTFYEELMRTTNIKSINDNVVNSFWNIIEKAYWIE